MAEQVLGMDCDAEAEKMRLEAVKQAEAGDDPLFYAQLEATIQFNRRQLRPL
jgi:hypothetical protein